MHVCVRCEAIFSNETINLKTHLLFYFIFKEYDFNERNN